MAFTSMNILKIKHLFLSITKQKNRWKETDRLDR